MFQISSLEASYKVSTSKEEEKNQQSTCYQGSQIRQIIW
jgi:hypothetical protein